MKKQYMRYFWLFFIFFCSCNDYLDVKSNSNYVIPKTLKDIQGLLDNASRMNMGASYSSYADILSDDYYLNNSIIPQTISDLNNSPYTWTMKEYENSSDWATIYSLIYNTNLALELLEKVERTPQNAFEWDRIKGSALFIRSFHFLGLVTLHGHAFDEKTADTNLGIPLRMTSDFNVKSTRATIRECYDRILIDLQEAIKLLPISEKVQTRPTKVAALALLARTNLYMGKYREAGDFAKQALQHYSTLMNFNGDDDILGLNEDYPFKQFNKETIFYVSTTLSGAIFTVSRATVDSLLFNEFKPNDLRLKTFFKLTNNIPFFKGNYTGSNVRFCGITTAELFLTLAEAEAFLGNIEEALSNLNILLKTRWDKQKEYVNIHANTREEALNLVRWERRKELMYRNLRWIDVKRYNREGAGIVLQRNINGKAYSLNPFDPYYAFPLPKDIIEMTGMPQN